MGRKIYKCSICGYQTRIMQNFKQHQQTHLAPEERQMFSCTHCEKKYMSKLGLKHHLYNDHVDSRSQKAEEKICRCAICGYQTPNTCNFYRHKQIHLLTPRERQMFPCAQCNNKYKTKVGLQYHLENNHTDSRAKKLQKNVYRCAICDFKTRYESSLRRHETVHLAPKERQLYACAHCDKKYRQKDGLKYHFEINHIDSRTKELKKYICAICNYQTLHKSNLNKHAKVHLVPKERQMFACEQCDKKYLTNQKLQDHIQRNHDSRSKEMQKKIYKCAICGYQTSRESHFRTHQEIHLAPEERQIFACGQCDKKYMSNQRLQNHIKRHHNDARNADYISVTEEVILDSLKIEINDHALLLDKFTNAECPAMTNEVKSEDFIKTEPDDVALRLNKDMHDDFKNSECLSETIEVKSEDIIKMEPVAIAPVLNKDMCDSFKNIENVVVSKKVKLEGFIKMEPEDDAPFLNEKSLF